MARGWQRICSKWRKMIHLRTHYTVQWVISEQLLRRVDTYWQPDLPFEMFSWGNKINEEIIGKVSQTSNVLFREFSELNKNWHEKRHCSDIWGRAESSSKASFALCHFLLPQLVAQAFVYRDNMVSFTLLTYRGCANTRVVGRRLLCELI